MPICCPLLLACPLPHSHPLQDKLPQNIVDEVTTALKDVRAAQEAEDVEGRRGRGHLALLLVHASVVQRGAA